MAMEIGVEKQLGERKPESVDETVRTIRQLGYALGTQLSIEEDRKSVV